MAAVQLSITDRKSFGEICTNRIVFIVYEFGRHIYHCCALNHQISKLQIENLGVIIEGTHLEVYLQWPFYR